MSVGATKARRCPQAIRQAVWCAVGLILIAATRPPQSEFAGLWHGEVEVPAMPLRFAVELVEGADGWSGSIDLPTQQVRGLRLSAVVVDPPKLRFTLPAVAGSPEFAGEFDAGTIRGRFSQGAESFPFRLQRGALPAPRRPQEPKPPFPYVVETSTFGDGEGDGVLAATLTLPHGGGPHPAAVLVSGSGAQDRDGSAHGHRPFLVLADHLTRSGYAVLRVDDRGVGGSSGTPLSAGIEAAAADVAACVDFLRADPRIRGDAIGLIGHSDGGSVAVAAAVQKPPVAYVVLLASPGLPGEQVLTDQLESIATANGVVRAAVERQLELQRAAIAVARSTDPLPTRRSALARVVREQIGLPPLSQGPALDAALTQSAQTVLSPWFRSFLDHDPRPLLRALRVPVLVIAGGRDLQVATPLNVPVIARALLVGGNRHVTMRVLPHLNHLLQTAQTGSPQEYSMIEETLALEALLALTDWLTLHFPAHTPAP